MSEPEITKSDVILGFARIIVKLGKNDFQGVRIQSAVAMRKFELWMATRPEKAQMEQEPYGNVWQPVLPAAVLPAEMPRWSMSDCSQCHGEMRKYSGETPAGVYTCIDCGHTMEFPVKDEKGS